MNQTKFKNSVFKNHPDATFHASELGKDEDKDEEIIALQNKIISFNQQHINEMKELREDNEREYSKLIQEKDTVIKSYLNRIEELDSENNYVSNQNQSLKDKLEQNDRILSELESELIQNPNRFSNDKIEDSEVKRKRKNKKSMSKGSLSESVNTSIHHVAPRPYQKAHAQLKGTEFIVYPSPLISLLIESKKNEASAVCELKALNRDTDILQETIGRISLLTLIDQKEHYIRQLEDEMLKIKSINVNGDYATFGNSKATNEINIVDKESEENNESNCTQGHQMCDRRIKELESQVNDLRNREQNRLNELINYNKNRMDQIKNDAKFEGYHDDQRALLDSVACLCYEL